MYDELVKSLRICEGACNKECVLYNSVQIDGDTCQNRLCAMAADAIEERCQQVDKFAEEAARLYAKLPRWIPVTERLPKDLTRVIVFCEDGVSYGLCEHLIADDEEAVEWHDFLHYPITPTHWMPLPKPPKAEEGE